MKELVYKGEEYIPLVMRCFDAALRTGGFVRIGGAEKFGFENRKDYTPKTWADIFEYWYGCRDLLLEWMNKKPELVDLLAEMVEKNVYNWIRGGQKDILVPLLEKIAERKNYHWDKGYEALSQTVYAFGIDVEALGLSALMAKMRNESFKTQLNEARFKMHGHYHLQGKELMELSKELFTPLAAEFIDKEIYANVDEVKTLLEDNEYVPIDFVRTLVTTASDEQLGILFDTIFKVLTTKSSDFYSPFLGNLSSYSKDRKSLLEFLERLRNERHEFLYVSLMANTENKKLSHFHQLFVEQKNQDLEMDYLPIYLRFFRPDRGGHYLLMLKALRDNFPDRPNDLIAYVVTAGFMMREDENPEAVAIVKDALLKYQINGETGHMLHEYSRILIEILQLWHDPEFAKQVNRKFIDVYNTQMIHLSTEGIYTELLKSYFEDVWPEFVKAFFGTDTFLFYYQLKDELGAGFGFGKGPLFDVDERLIKQLCLDNPESAPARITSMAPCFDNEENMFNKWIIWILDNFGEQKDVRDSISSNLGSFSWTGDISPYYERNIKCFEPLLSHHKPEVREWAQRCINEVKKLLDVEKNKEDFMRIRYGM